jgi:hypothetical protein
VNVGRSRIARARNSDLLNVLATVSERGAAFRSLMARRRFEVIGQHAYAQRSAMSVIIAAQHRDVVKLPWSDRRSASSIAASG